PADVELALFRVVQEALTNVSRHSSGTFSRVRRGRNVARGKPAVILTVEDAGNGPAVHRDAAVGAGPSAGAGPASMRERLSQIGGWLDVDIDVAKTTVTAFVPDRP